MQSRASSKHGERPSKAATPHPLRTPTRSGRPSFNGPNGYFGPDPQHHAQGGELQRDHSYALKFACGAKVRPMRSKPALYTTPTYVVMSTSTASGTGSM
jgi:hypothetical protein